MNTTQLKEKSYRQILSTGLLFFTATSLAFSQAPLVKSLRTTNLNQQIQNGKQIYTALFSFAMDHEGLFPCDKTGPAATAEDCFNQLLAGGYLEDEKVFWNKNNRILGTVSAKAPNNDGILTANENSWGYVKGISTSSRTRLPILFDSSIKPRSFNSSVWKGKAVIVKLNGSVQAMDIDYGEKPAINKDGSGKLGPILEKRGTKKIDLFKALPNGVKILPPQLAK